MTAEIFNVQNNFGDTVYKVLAYNGPPKFGEFYILKEHGKDRWVLINGIHKPSDLINHPLNERRKIIAFC